jgi:hypothetical protein
VSKVSESSEPSASDAADISVRSHASGGYRSAPREWVVEVCRSCDRLAQWPFCSHRPQGLDAVGAAPWTETVRVREVGRRRRRT